MHERSRAAAALERREPRPRCSHSSEPTEVSEVGGGLAEGQGHHYYGTLLKTQILFLSDFVDVLGNQELLTQGRKKTWPAVGSALTFPSHTEQILKQKPRSHAYTQVRGNTGA